MLTKIKQSLNRPPRAPTRGVLLWLLSLQILLQATALVVVTVWPDKAFAIGPQLYVSLGFSALLVFAVMSGRGVSDKGVTQEPNG